MSIVAVANIAATILHPTTFIFIFVVFRPRELRVDSGGWETETGHQIIKPAVTTTTVQLSTLDTYLTIYLLSGVSTSDCQTCHSLKLSCHPLPSQTRVNRNDIAVIKYHNSLFQIQQEAVSTPSTPIQQVSRQKTALKRTMMMMMSLELL